MVCMTGLQVFAIVILKSGRIYIGYNTVAAGLTRHQKQLQLHLENQASIETATIQ